VSALLFCLWYTGGMRTILFISFAVAGRLLAQEMAFDSLARDTGMTREPVLERREVSGTSLGDPTRGVVLSREDLSVASTLSSALARIPGVQVLASGGMGSYTTLSLHGSPPEQVEVYLDGVPLGGSNGSTVDVGPYPLDGLQRAEIFQAGEEGSGASPRLDLVSRRGWSDWGGSVGIGSFGERSASGRWGDSSGRVAVAGWWETSQNDYPFMSDNNTPDNPSDDAIKKLSNNDFTGKGAFLGWRPSETLEGSVRWEASDQGLSTPLETNSLGRLDRQALQADLRKVDTGAWSDILEGSWRRGWSDWKDPTQSSGYLADIASDETSDDANASWSLRRRSGGWFDPRAWAGLRWEHSQRRSLGLQRAPETPDGNRSSGTLGLGWAGKTSDRFGADLEGRMDIGRDERDFLVALDSTPPIPDTVIWHHVWRGQARAWARWGEWSGWISASGKERVPDFSEWMGDNGSGLPNLGLKPEKSETVEIGSGWDQSGMHATLSVWDAEYEDPIEVDQAGGNSPLTIHRNEPGYEAAGLDGRLWGKIGRFAGFAGGTLQKARTDDPNPALNGSVPRNTPRWKGSVAATADLGWGSTLGYTLDAQGSTWESEPNTSDVYRPGRAIHGIWLRWHRGQVSVLLAARNLTDVHTQDLWNLTLSGRQYQSQVDVDFDANRSSTIPSTSTTSENLEIIE
jgi:hypothetical protein